MPMQMHLARLRPRAGSTALGSPKLWARPTALLILMLKVWWRLRH
jgi:hypothetical protein